MGKAKHAAGGFKSKMFGSKKSHEMKHAKPQENDDAYKKYVEENFDKNGFWKKDYHSEGQIERNDSNVYEEDLKNTNKENAKADSRDVISQQIDLDVPVEDEPENDYGFDALSSLSAALSTDGKFSFTRHTNKEYKKEEKPSESISENGDNDDDFAKALLGAIGSTDTDNDTTGSNKDVEESVAVSGDSLAERTGQMLDDLGNLEENDLLVVNVGAIDENNDDDGISKDDSKSDAVQEVENLVVSENEGANVDDATSRDATTEMSVVLSGLSEGEGESVETESEGKEDFSVINDIGSDHAETGNSAEQQVVSSYGKSDTALQDEAININSEKIDNEKEPYNIDSAVKDDDREATVNEEISFVSKPSLGETEEKTENTNDKDDFDEELSSILSMISEIENKGKASTVSSQDEINVEDNSNQLKSSDDSNLVVAEPIDDVPSEEIRDSKEMSSEENDTIAHSLIEEPAEEASLDNNIDEPKVDDSECCETEILEAYSDEVDANVDYADENVDGTKEEAKKDENKKDKKNKKPFDKQKLRYLIFAAVALVVGISIILGAILINNDKTYGPYCKVGDHVVSKADYNFFYNSTVNNFVSTYKNYLDYIGLDLSKDFSEQQYTSDQTWQEFFQEQTLDFMKEVYALSDAGYEAGISEDNSTYETVSTNLINSAKESGVTEQEFLTQIYGSGASKKHIEKMLKMYCVAIEYSNQLKETTMVPNDEEVLKYYSTHKDDYDSVTYRVFTFEAKPTGGTKNEYGDIEYTDKEWLEAMGVANKKASNFFEQVYDESTFKALCLKYADKDEKDKYSAKNDGSLNTKQGKSAINSVLSDWLYDSARQKDATAIIEDAENHCYHIVYFIGRERDETPTVNVRHILISPDSVEKPDENATDAEKATYEAKVAEADKSAKEKADEVYKSWLDGEKTEDSFESLAKQYSADGSNTGTYENVGRGQMVGEFDSWIFDDSRKTGDTGIVKTEYGYHIIYFVGRGEPKWKTSIKETLADENYDTYIINLKKNYTFEDIKGELKYLSDKEISNDLKQELGINDATPDSIKIN